MSTDGFIHLFCWGLAQPNTMKLQGEVKGRITLVLIDSGASHNFITVDLVSQLGLSVEPTPSYNVRLGDGHKKELMRAVTM